MMSEPQMTTQHEETQALLRQLAQGDRSAGDQLLRRHRERLTRLISMRVDHRVKGRFDPSDIVQEALVIANDRLPKYAEDQQIPFYPWLRGIAVEQLIKYHEKHVHTQKRSVNREEKLAPRPNDESINELVDRLAGHEESPSVQMVRREKQERIRRALDSLRPRDREIIELRYLEQLENAEIAAVLNISMTAVRTRHFRALQRLNHVLQDGSET